MKNTNFTSYLSQLETTLDLYLVKKAPNLPVGAKEAIVKFGPYIALILLVLSLPILLAAFGLSAMFAPVAMMGGAAQGVNYMLGIVVLVVALVLQALALPGLFKRQKSAWNLMFYSILVSAVYYLLTLNIGGLIIGTLISLYILFQVREYYK